MPLVKTPLSFAIKVRSANESTWLSWTVSHLMLTKPWSLLMSHLRLDSASRLQGEAIENIKWLWHAQQGRTSRDLPADSIFPTPVDDVCH